jgi:hypothetical protein
MLITRAGMAHKKADDKLAGELRSAVYARKKDFTEIKKLTESLEKKLEKA